MGAMCVANAQDKAVSLGLRAGLNVNTLTYSGNNEAEIRDLYKSHTGFHIGAVVNCKVAGNFYLQPGIYFTTRGAKQEENSSEDGFNYSFTQKTNMSYLQIPVSASYRFPVGKIVKIDINVGPYVAIGLGGKVKIEATESYEGETETYSEKYDVFGKSTKEETRGDFKRFDAGLRFGAGVHISKFNIGLIYDLGLANLAHTGDNAWNRGTKFRNGSFLVSVGYNF